MARLTRRARNQGSAIWCTLVCVYVCVCVSVTCVCVCVYYAIKSGPTVTKKVEITCSVHLKRTLYALTISLCVRIMGQKVETMALPAAPLPTALTRFVQNHSTCWIDSFIFFKKHWFIVNTVHHDHSARMSGQLNGCHSNLVWQELVH